MIIKKFKFNISTNKYGSDCEDEIEIQFDDDETEEEIENQVNQIYQDWLNEKNQGFWIEIK